MRLLVAATFFAFVTPFCTAQNIVLDDNAPSSVPKKPVSFDLSGIDKTADPCTDFYQYACGNWMKNNPMPSDQVRWGRFNELGEYNNYLLYKELQAAADAPKTPLQKKYGDFYASCMNTERINALGAKPLQPDLDAIAAIKSTKDIAAYNSTQERRGGGAFFAVRVTQDHKDSSQQIAATGQGGLTLPDRDYYLNTSERSQKVRDQYVEHMVKMFVLLGDSQEQAKKEAADTLRIETALAKGSMDRVQMRNPENTYHMMSVEELQKMSPNFNWKQYLDGIGMPQVKSIDVTSPQYVETANGLLGSENLDAIKAYLRWHAIHGAAPALSKPFEDENFAFFAATLNGQKEQQPRWRRCTAGTDRALGQAVGQDWVKENFPPQAKDNMEKLVHALEAAMAEDIKHLDWMSETTKVEARKKLDAIADKIGYPKNWIDYSSFEVKRDDYLGNLERSSNFERKRNLAKLGKPVDPTEFGMTPPTVNASYNPAQNNIQFPAGILQPPFYDNSLDAAVNFGGIGVVIGHEMTHGFDDEGSKFDAKGNVRQWWTDEDKKKFEERSECTAKEYDGFETAPGQNLNGHLTLGENSADNAGIRIAFQALQATMAQQGGPGAGYTDGKRDGYTPAQRFFIGFAQVWCENSTEQVRRVRAKTDPHSTGKWRTDGTVQNFEEFGKAFGCKVGQPMMPASGGCRTW